MSPDLRGALSRIVARVTASPFAKPVARVALAAGALVLLAIIGSRGTGGAIAAAASAASATPAGAATPTASTPVPTLPPTASSELGQGPPRAGTAAAGGAAGTAATATPDSPVVLNAATEDDLRRLPGIGPKRAVAILALRMRLGRFRAVEDLLKVKGIGRATLKRLRPLVRLEAPAMADAGAPPTKT